MTVLSHMTNNVVHEISNIMRNVNLINNSVDGYSPPAPSPANAKKSPPDPPALLVLEPDCKRIPEAETFGLSVLAAEMAT
jgi:hypothetical protein